MLKLFVASLKILVRNRPFVFWSFMFPLMFTLMFGSFFGSGGGGAALGTVALVNESNTPVAKGLQSVLEKIDGVRVRRHDSLADAKASLKQGDRNAIIHIPAGFGSPTPGSPTKVRVICDPGSPQTGQVVTGIVERCVSGLESYMRQTKPMFGVEVSKAGRRGLNYFDYVMIGLLTMALMNSSVQGVAVVMSKYREDKILKRVMTTPLPQWKFIAANVLSRLVINVLQIAVILFVGIRVFDASVHGSIPLLCAFSMASAVLFQLVGFSIASISKTAQAAEGMSTTFTVPMMLLSGIFMPLESLPMPLQTVMHYLPVAPLLNLMRGIALQSKSPLDDPKNLIIVGAWIIALFAFTCWKFRLSEE